MKKLAVVIYGPTGVGKTSASLSVAKRLGGEIISADSMQVYKGMNIGTAKISKEEMKKYIPSFKYFSRSPLEYSDKIVNVEALLKRLEIK